MAAGDVTLDSNYPKQDGSVWLLCGVIEVDDTKRAFALTSTKSTLLDCMVVDEDGVGSPQVELNKNASGTATNGTIAVMGNHQSVDTYRFRATYIG